MIDPAHLMRWMIEQGYDAVMNMPDGRIAAVTATATGGSQVIRGTLDTVDDRWTYEHRDEAMIALARWSPRMDRCPEPSGWVRHQPSNRRRRYDLSRPGGYNEWVAP